MNRPRPAFFALLWILLGLLGGGAEARAVEMWHRSYNEAMAEAKAEGKHLLIVFTGSDWIEMCAKFYEEVLGQPDFIEAVSGKFALLKLEYPKDSQLPRGEAAEKALLRDAYRVKGFPTVVLAEVSGKPFGLNGFQPVSAEEYAKQLLDIAATHQANREAAAQAGALEGAEKAEALSRAVPDLPGSLVVRYYRKEMEAAIAADPEKQSKVVESFRSLLASADDELALQGFVREGKWAEAIALIDRQIAERKLEGLPLQAALLFRAGFEKRSGRGEAAEKTLRSVVEIDGDSEPGREAARLLERSQAAGDSGKAGAPKSEPGTDGPKP